MTTLASRRARLTILIPSKSQDRYGYTIATQLTITGAGSPPPNNDPGARILFKIKKSTEKEPDPGEISVSNLSPHTRSSLQNKGLVVRLEAGYNDALTTIYEGDIRTVDHVREKATWVTKLRLGASERFYRYSRSHISFPAGTTAAEALTRIVNASGIGPGNLAVAASAGLSSVIFRAGKVISGSTQHAIDQLLKSIPYQGRGGWSWSVVDGSLQVLAPGQQLATSIPLLTPTSGLISSPETGTPEKVGKPALMKIRALLTPVRAGGRVHIRSANYDTDVYVKKLEHEGDTHGAAWYTLIFGVLTSSK